MIARTIEKILIVKMSTKGNKQSTGTSASTSLPPAKRQKASSSASFSSTAVAPIFSSTKIINELPFKLWEKHICKPFMRLSELSIMRRSHTSFEKYWQKVVAERIIRVPQGCATVEKAMDLAVIFSERKEFTENDPLKIKLDEGIHEIAGDQYGHLNVTCSHITFVGKGADHTTVRGGFTVENQQNVTFEELAVTGFGLCFKGSDTKVDVLNCAVKECTYDGMAVWRGATVTATQCEFMENMGNGVHCDEANTTARLNDCAIHHNGIHGLVADEHAAVDLHGTKTGIHSNEVGGIVAIRNGKVNIHLPDQHKTSYDNVREDRFQDEGGGTIANINLDCTGTLAL